MNAQASAEGNRGFKANLTRTDSYGTQSKQSNRGVQRRINLILWLFSVSSVPLCKRVFRYSVIGVKEAELYVVRKSSRYSGSSDKR